MSAAHATISCVGGIEDEVTDLYRLHSAALLAYAGSYGRPEIAHDAVQEAFMRYFVERRYGRKIGNPRAWLYSVVRNTLVDMIKAAGAGEPAGERLDVLQEAGPDPERVAQSRQAAREIAGSLTAREFACLRLRAGGSAYAEIAQSLQLQPGTVGALLGRAQRKLRHALGTMSPAEACLSLRCFAEEAPYSP